MNGALKLFAWTVALTLVALPIVGVLNGWFAADRWPVTRLSVQAEFDHVSAEQIRAAAQPHLGQGFFAIHLGPLRDAIAKLPWVERVEARKRWPDTVDLVVYEQQPYARWGADRLVNRHGKLFAVADAAELQGLPRLSGPTTASTTCCASTPTASANSPAAASPSPRSPFRRATAGASGWLREP